MPDPDQRRGPELVFNVLFGRVEVTELIPATLRTGLWRFVLLNLFGERRLAQRIALWIDADEQRLHPPALLADPTRAARVIGFEARQTDLIQIIRDAAPSFGLAPPMEETDARIPA